MPDGPVIDGTARLTDQRLRCSACGAGFTFEVGEQRFFAEHALVPPKRCAECRETERRSRNDARELSDMTSRECCTCGEPFRISVAEREWLQSRGYVESRRCRRCREVRRRTRAAAAVASGSSDR